MSAKSVLFGARRGFLLIPIAIPLGWFAVSPAARAVTPAPDGGYPNGNTAEGQDALKSLTTGISNTATGFQALLQNTTGGFNTATGLAALQKNTTGSDNTATGEAALRSNTTGGNNTANGTGALGSNITGGNNTAIGAFALSFNTFGDVNTATGFFALQHNTIGSGNTAIGVDALQNNTIGQENTATGEDALGSNTTGFQNTATGVAVLEHNTTGNLNTAIGEFALQSNTTGGFNTAIGEAALQNNTTGSTNIALGFRAGLFITGGNNIDIGNLGVNGDSNNIRIGTVGVHAAAFIAGILGATVPSGVGVIVGTNGQLGTATSSERFKEAIKPMGRASEAILALKPVTFRYKRKLDPDGIPQFGLVAEQVEKVNPDLVARDPQRKVITVRYEAVNAMLLNEFLKEHRKVQELEAAIARQQKEIKALSASLKVQASQIGKVREASSN